jgi:predicted nucleotide-binding protein (sugar kinase/HSP70/actin superfamily)
MSFLKQLLKPFVEFEDDGKNLPKPPQTTPPSQASAPKPVPPVPVPAPTPEAPAAHPLVSGSTDVEPTPKQIPTYSPGGTISVPLPEHQQYFEKLIDEANVKNPFFQGADFKEFIDSKVDIDDIADEQIKYRTAFNVLKSTGLTKEKLLSTGQEYLNIIGRDLNAFQSAHSQQYAKEVRQKELLIQKKVEELQALTLRINALKGEINSVTQDINLTKEKLNTVRQSFLLAGENKQNEIQRELEKIASFF